MDPRTPDPLIALEEKLAFQQRQFEELNGVVLEQQAELERHRRKIAELASLLGGVLDRSGEDLPHEKPPHY